MVLKAIYSPLLTSLSSYKAPAVKGLLSNLFNNLLFGFISPYNILSLPAIAKVV